MKLMRRDHCLLLRGLQRKIPPRLAGLAFGLLWWPSCLGGEAELLSLQIHSPRSGFRPGVARPWLRAQH